MSARDEMRDGLGIGRGETVALVLYESQTEHIWRQSAVELAGRYNRLLVLPLTERARKHFGLTWQNQASNVLLVDDMGVEEAADEIIAFRIIEDLIVARKAPVRILDPVNRWLSQELAQ